MVVELRSIKITVEVVTNKSTSTETFEYDPKIDGTPVDVIERAGDYLEQQLGVERVAEGPVGQEVPMLKSKEEIKNDIQAILENDDSRREIWVGSTDTDSVSEEMVDEEKAAGLIADYIVSERERT